MRRALARHVATLLVATASLGVLPAAAGEGAVGASEYVVRQDLRRCPSPMCGGYWVARANHARTRCHDGLRRPRCYVADAVTDEGRALTSPVPEEALVRGTIAERSFPGLGTFGLLAVEVVRKPVGAAGKGRYFRLHDTGVRCVREPCFSWRAWRLNATARVDVSGVDLDAASLTRSERKRAEQALAGRTGLYAFGRIVRASGGSRVFRASRVYLTVPPRA